MKVRPGPGWSCRAPEVEGQVFLGTGTNEDSERYPAGSSGRSTEAIREGADKGSNDEGKGNWED